MEPEAALDKKVGRHFNSSRGLSWLDRPGGTGDRTFPVIVDCCAGSNSTREGKKKKPVGDLSGNLPPNDLITLPSWSLLLTENDVNDGKS